MTDCPSIVNVYYLLYYIVNTRSNLTSIWYLCKTIFLNIIIKKSNTVEWRYTFSTIPVTHTYTLYVVPRFIQSTHPSYTKSLSIKATTTKYYLMFMNMEKGISWDLWKCNILKEKSME